MALRSNRENRDFGRAAGAASIFADAAASPIIDTNKKNLPARGRIDLARVPGAEKSKLPDFLYPELATLVDQVPAGDEWLHEIKFDGYRALCRIERGRVNFFTREGNDWTERFGKLAAAAAALPAERALLDGEVVVMEPGGATDFQSLQEALGKNQTDRLAYFVFDLIHLDGYDLTRAALSRRKEVLARVVSRRAAAIRFSDHVVGDGAAFYREACRLGLEGVISKRKDSPYRPGRSRDWLKIKCHASQEFVIGGFTDPAGARAGLGALLLGVYDERGDLVYAGRVGTGFNQQSLTDLRSRLERIAVAAPPFGKKPGGYFRERVHWTEPKLVAEVEFTGWTRDGLLRHPSFKGLREDKPAKKIKRERPAPAPSGASGGRGGAVKIAGVTLTNPDRVLYPEQGITKRELALFYEGIAERILPHVTDRPLTLVRCPAGYRKACFYQKHIHEQTPAEIRQIPIEERNSSGLYLVIDSLPGLISLVQMGVLEIHTWGSRSDRLEQPDRLIFDLDPDADLSWSRVVDAALALRARLEELGLVAFAKTTGGKGLHVVVPIVRKHRWDEIKQFTKNIAELMTREEPERYLATMAKAKRRGKIFIDYLRNGRGATAVAAYSTRARAGAPVSAPLGWDEVEAGVRSDRFNIRNLSERLAAQDPWENYESSRRPITAAMMKTVGGDARATKSRR